MLLKDVRGLRFPDESVIRFFFKEFLFEKPGHVLELGCGNGNNLCLFYQYDWQVTGIDVNAKSIETAIANFTDLKCEYNLTNNFGFIRNDMLNFANHFSSKSVDALILPSSLYYLDEKEIINLFELFRQKQILMDGHLFFFRIRLTDDYRYGKGKKISENTFLLDIDETGEKGCTMTFFSKESFLNLIRKCFAPTNLKIHPVSFVNFQRNDKEIFNSDLIVWGNCKYS